MSTDKTPDTQERQGKGTRPGAMTMAMQAVSVKPAGPKVLRIGLIQAGKIIEERVIRKRETVTVGSSEKNHFVIHTDGMPGRFELFQLVGNDYILNFTDIMSGRVGLPGGVQDLTQMRQSGAARNAGSHYQVKLNDNSRGKVVIGGTTLLFQFVIPPPVQPRPQLPAAARAGFVRSIDWLFTAFMVFTFMSMFGFIVYLENADWPIDEGLAAVPEDLAKILFEEPPPPPPEVKADETPTDDSKANESASGGDLRQRAGGGTSGVAGLGSLARKEGTTGAVNEGGAVTERKVSGTVKTEHGDEIGGQGEFDSNTVVQQIKTRLRAIQMCYEQQLRRNPTLAGKVSIEFTIQPRGNVTDVRVKDNTTGDAAVATCVANTVSLFRFNPGPEGGSVTYSYPFVFAPQN
jgi:TonB family protein